MTSKTWTKKAVLDAVGKEIWENILNGKALEDPSLLSRFVLLTFADLKKYHYYYWFAFPCLCPAEDYKLSAQVTTVQDVYSQDQIIQLTEEYNRFQSDSKDKGGYFIIVPQDEQVSIQPLKQAGAHIAAGRKVIFGFADPSTLDSYPGWPLRNFLALISHHWGAQLSNVEVVCFRYFSKGGKHNISSSLYLHIELSPFTSTDSCPKCVGWEKNERQKLGPRMVNLSATMDPHRLAESAVDLNLKLMRWRLQPDLDLTTISQTKCLLLGAGTLGCNVARCLLGWGVRTITLVDNGRVSYSNPVRQSLFVFSDCLQTAGGRPKAEAAAEALQKIFPGVNAFGLSLSIPMPGHAVSESAIEQTKADVEKLDSLISSHDAVFLLLDTRESRWLPTVMAAAKHKTVICSALGYDTFLVMRHGCHGKKREEPAHSESTSLKAAIPGHMLGCYFCNDVVAPGDSTRDRTLDQQCTVSRPGMSYIASALAVELLVSVLQHPARDLAPAETGLSDDMPEQSSVLGLVPHQIRGFLSRFQQIMPASRAFDKCTACSRIVVEHYEKEGFDFLLKAFNDPHYLEDLTGLTQMHEETSNAEIWDFEADEEFSSMDSS